MLTPYPDIDSLAERIRARIETALGGQFAGLYIFGSVATGDYETGISDLDLVAATAGELGAEALERLEAMHRKLALEEKAWDNRLEIHYISVRALRKYRPHYRQPQISPGDPFQVKEADTSWVINRRILRDHGITVCGPSIRTLVDPVSSKEVLQAIRATAPQWHEYVPHIRQRKAQAFAILTMCRALYAFKHNALVSKKQAAEWLAAELPEWSSLVQSAFAWRAAPRNEPADHEATLPDTLRFVRLALTQFDR